MQADLVHTATPDGIRLDGMFLAPQGVSKRLGPVDAVLIVHGSSGNFYLPSVQNLAVELQAAGYPIAAFNTRAHDILWGQGFGNAFDNVDTARLDIGAALSWLAARGHERIAIAGISLGAVKAVYYQAKVMDARVTAIMAISPVRLSHRYYLDSEGAEEYLRFYNEAQQLIEAGRPDALFRATFPLSTTYAAAAFIDKHGPEEKYDIVKLAAEVGTPQLFIAGTLETHPRLRNCARDAYEAAKRNSQAHYVMVEGADHTFPGMASRLAAEIIAWLRGLEHSDTAG